MHAPHSRPAPHAADSSETLSIPRSLTTAASSSRVWRRHGHRNVASSAAPPRSIASSSPTSGLHEPQPAPARVTLTTSSVEPRPRVRMASTISPLHTPWQLHTRALSGRSAAVAWDASASSASGSAASRPVRTASISSSEPRMSPSRIVPTVRPSGSTTSLR